jgi:hypothetical protein
LPAIPQVAFGQDPTNVDLDRAFRDVQVVGDLVGAGTASPQGIRADGGQAIFRVPG